MKKFKLNEKLFPLTTRGIRTAVLEAPLGDNEKEEILKMLKVKKLQSNLLLCVYLIPAVVFMIFVFRFNLSSRNILYHIFFWGLLGLSLLISVIRRKKGIDYEHLIQALSEKYSLDLFIVEM